MRKLVIHGTAITQPPSGYASLPGLIVPRLLRVQDAARYLSATTWFIETLIREKQIPSLIIGKRRVIDVNDLDLWIESQKIHQASTGAAPSPPPERAACGVSKGRAGKTVAA